MPIISVQNAAVRYGCNEQNLYSIANYHKKKGIDTPWFIGDKNKSKMIDTDAYERQSKILKQCYDYNTTYLYWLAVEILGNETRLSEYMAKNSLVFKSQGSWAVWINQDMWSPLYSIMVALEPTQHSEFFLLVSKLVYDNIKQNKELGKDFK